MGLIEKIKKGIHEILHPSFESLMHEFAIVEDNAAMTEERLEHFRFMIEQKRAEEAHKKAMEEKNRMRKEARAVKQTAKAYKSGRVSGSK